MLRRNWINAVAPIRICDIGGWTDTWFSEHGYVFNIAVYPYVEVQIKITEEAKDIIVRLENYGDRFNFVAPIKINGGLYGETYTYRAVNTGLEKHPLIEKALEVMAFPKESGMEINIYSAAPPGASTGTSAAVSVALIGALNKLMNDHMTTHEIAMFAHALETQHLGLQCGVQDQLASAYGGINAIQITSFPHSIVSPINISDDIWWELEQRLCVIYIGKPHKSSEVHQKVIESLGKDAAYDVRLKELRSLAKQAKNAIFDGDFQRFGEVMNHNTEIQRQLHTELVCQKTEGIISLAQHYGVMGCKVNGAGGDGGSLTLLFGEDRQLKRQFLEQLSKETEVFHLPVYLSRKGLRVW